MSDAVEPAENAKRRALRHHRLIFGGMAGGSLVAIILLLVMTSGRSSVEPALFAAALSSLGLGLVRLADGFEERPDYDRRRRASGYPKFWLVCFAVAFAGLIVTGLLSRLPRELETPWLHKTRPQRPVDARCAALDNARASDAQLLVALRAGCR